MNKKFLSAILFGALMVTSTGTFVSCKDYDDDIDNLQTQIDKLATKDDLSSQIATLQSALSAASSSASDAIAKATAAEAAAKAAGDEAAAAKAAAEKSAAEAEAAAIKAAKETVDAAKAELEALIAAGMAENKAELEKMAATVAAAKKEVEKAVGTIADMVTSVELIYSNAQQQNQNWVSINVYKENFANGIWTNERLTHVQFDETYDEDGNLTGYNYYWTSSVNKPWEGDVINTTTVVEKENTFGPNESSFIKFTKDAQVQRGDKFVVRVSPTNAVLTPEMISLVNSQGQVLDMMEVKSVKRYEGLLTRAAGANGLWEVEVALKEYNKDAFAAAEYKANVGTILYAVQVNNTLSTAATRNVVSTYDLWLSHSGFSGLNRLHYWVDNTPVSRINNRVHGWGSNSLPDWNAYEKMHKEMQWSGSAAVSPITEGANQNVYWVADIRTGEPVYPAVQGVPMTITLSRSSSVNQIYDASQYIKAMYVTLDTQNAVESAPSELNAWNSYTYTGLNKVVEGTSTTITINAEKAIDDIIGFRVYAVNWDGTLVDPDGKAFYVRLGEKADNWNAAATTVVPMSESMNQTSDKVNVTLTKVAASYATWTTDKIKAHGTETQPVFDAVFVDAKDNVLYRTSDMNNFPADFSKVAKVYTVPTLDCWSDYADDKTYNGKLTIYNNTNHVVATMNVSMTKVLPTTIPTGFSVKTAQVAEGIYNCYMIPMANGVIAWEANTATEGTMKMSEVFNFGKGTPANYQITFAESTVKDDKLASITVNGEGTLSVAKKYIDNATQHATSVVYNYGYISSVKDANGNLVAVKRSATDFQTIYNCVYNNTYSWSWATNDQAGEVDGVDYAAKKDGKYINALPKKELTYGTDYAFKADKFIYGTSAWDGIYSKILFGNESLEIQSAVLTSDANGEEEYFDVIVENNTIINFKAIKVSSTTNPTAAVPSTLTIKCKDMYGHDVVIKLAMTVNKR